MTDASALTSPMGNSNDFTIHLYFSPPQDVNPDYIEAVKDGWRQLTAIRNYEKVAGSVLFQK